MTSEKNSRPSGAIPKPMLIGLSQSKSEIGRVLRQLPIWLLKEADRREQQDWEAHDRRQQHADFLLPWPDPWQFLIDTKPEAVPREIKIVCKAAQSQLHAMKRLARIGLGIATLNNDWQEVAEKAQVAEDKHRLAYALQKQSNALAFFEPTEGIVKGYDAELLPEFERQRKDRRALLLRWNQKDEAKVRKIPQVADEKNLRRVEYWLTEYWVWFDPCPGLMFWSDDALCRGLSIFERVQTSLDGLRKVRQRLGLIHAFHKNPLVTNLESAGSRVTGFTRSRQKVFDCRFT